MPPGEKIARNPPLRPVQPSLPSPLCRPAPMRRTGTGPTQAGHAPPAPAAVRVAQVATRLFDLTTKVTLERFVGRSVESGTNDRRRPGEHGNRSGQTPLQRDAESAHRMRRIAAKRETDRTRYQLRCGRPQTAKKVAGGPTGLASRCGPANFIATRPASLPSDAGVRRRSARDAGRGFG